MRIDIGIVIGAVEYDAEIEIEVEEGAVQPSATLWLGKEQSNIRLPHKLCLVIQRELEYQAAETAISEEGYD